MQKNKKRCSMRIGHGYDVHRLVEGRKLILGGVEIPFDKGLLGHSDADVLLHAISDALLGAAALGDIGKHFPPSDDAFKDADSRMLLREVVKLLRKNGYKAINIDATILAENPKMRPFIDEMRKNIAEDLKLDISLVSVKATTEEGLGFTGSGEGISAHAVCLID
jgi:2-C-methyl-D-erythritol 2,4-cyclodiphosphate synthase